MNPSDAISNVTVLTSVFKVNTVDWTQVLGGNPSRIAVYFGATGDGKWFLMPISGSPPLTPNAGPGIGPRNYNFVWSLDGPICTGAFWALVENPALSVVITEVLLNREDCGSTRPVRDTSNPVAQPTRLDAGLLDRIQQSLRDISSIPTAVDFKEQG